LLPLTPQAIEEAAVASLGTPLTLDDVQTAVDEMGRETEALLSMVMGVQDLRALDKLERLAKLNTWMVDELADMLPADIVEQWRWQEEQVAEAVRRRREELERA
jgi:hypothetical protein